MGLCVFECVCVTKFYRGINKVKILTDRETTDKQVKTHHHLHILPPTFVEDKHSKKHKNASLMEVL